MGKETNALYTCKCIVFSRFAQAHNLPAAPMTLDTLFAFFLHVPKRILFLSAFKVYVAGIVLHRLQDNNSLLPFHHPTQEVYLRSVRQFPIL